MFSKLKNQWSDFTNFIYKGDLAKFTVAFIMGQLFTKVVASFSTDIVMPPINWFLSNRNFDNLKLDLNNQGISINYGIFLQKLFEFLLVSFILYLILNIFLKKIEKTQENTITQPNLELNAIKNIESLEKEKIELLKQISASLKNNQNNHSSKN
ncbi:large conductance mechanosensitive channel protein MscL [Candidatus Phytoplasma phoenicium]|uniref:Large conductance mechanosensitive channel protein MscL n=1 Tax=Candidatus Phytoplasma phoenicium TaxID=198422 RepID=A0A2S8NUT1_9MOLU|nr:large conductance mechanosensitive channel protein MscL [Candidatus Phytoplasma phoenicium]